MAQVLSAGVSSGPRLFPQPLKLVICRVDRLPSTRLVMDRNRLKIAEGADLGVGKRNGGVWKSQAQRAISSERIFLRPDSPAALVDEWSRRELPVAVSQIIGRVHGRDPRGRAHPIHGAAGVHARHGTRSSRAYWKAKSVTRRQIQVCQPTDVVDGIVGGDAIRWAPKSCPP